VKRTVLAGFCLLFVLGPARGQTADEKKATVAYLRSLETKEGGYRLTAQAAPPSLRATTAALRALGYCGGEPRDRSACAGFVTRCYHVDSGGFSDRPGARPDVTTTAIGLMAVVELKIPAGPYAERAVKYLGANASGFEEVRIAAAGLEAVGKLPPQARGWLEQLARRRHEDGTYGRGDDTARATGGAVVTVLRLGGKVEQPAAVLRALNAGQSKDGGFGRGGAGHPGTGSSDLESTYRVLRAFVMLRARPEGAQQVRDFVGRCRNPDGGYGVAPGQPSSASGTYYASIILRWLGETKRGSEAPGRPIP
jgi:hypothetical protein